MGQVIGPIDHASWFTLIQIRSCLKVLNEKVVENPKHRPAIEKEKAIYREILDPYLKGDVNEKVVAKRFGSSKPKFKRRSKGEA